MIYKSGILSRVWGRYIYIYQGQSKFAIRKGERISRRDFDDSPTYMHVVMLIPRSSIGGGGSRVEFCKGARHNARGVRLLLSPTSRSFLRGLNLRGEGGFFFFFFARITTSRVLPDNNNRDRYAGSKRCNSSGKLVGNDGKESSCESRFDPRDRFIV